MTLFFGDKHQQVSVQYIIRPERKQFQIECMRTAKNIGQSTSYLDVSQYIIKEHSPLLKPLSPQYRHHAQITRHQATPEIGPIDHDTSQIMLTPITSGLIRQEIEDIMEDFMLESSQNYLFDVKSQSRRKKSRKEGKELTPIKEFYLQCDLQRIMENDYQESDFSEFDSDSSQEFSQIYEEDHCYVNSNTMFTSWPIKIKSKDSTCKDTEQQKQTTIDISVLDYSESIDRFNKNPKMEIARKLREIEAMSGEADEDEKKLLIKKHLEKYLLEYEIFCYEESWKELNNSLSETVAVVLQGIEQTFSKKIGALSFENRRIKLLKYLEKKKRRIWRKKVSYDCRKKVADGRLRIKGKFVTREQACEQLGLQTLHNFSAQQIKDMLQKKMEENGSLIC